MTRRQQGELSGWAPRTIHYHELSQSALFLAYTRSHKVAGPIRQSHTILMGCGVDWCRDYNDGEADRLCEHGEWRKYWNLKIDRFLKKTVWLQNGLRGIFNENRWSDRWSTKFEGEKTVSGIYFFSLVLKQEKDLRFNKPWILSQRVCMLFFGETDMRGGMWWGKREAAQCSRGESNYMNLVLPSTKNTYTHSLHQSTVC